MRLSSAKTGRWIAVSAMPSDPEAEQEIRTIGIAPGRPIRVIRRAPLWGPLLLDVGDRTVAVRWKLASRLVVQAIAGGGTAPTPDDG